jgi:predicted nucleic acid-binding protein
MPCGLLIADSGPLIALTRLELLPLLCSRFDEVWLPGKVLDEVTRDMQRADARIIASAVEKGLLKRVDVTVEETSAVLRFGLDPGESEAIALACRQPALLLIDERKGRLAAQSLGLAIIGVVGVLITLRVEGASQQQSPISTV